MSSNKENVKTEMVQQPVSDEDVKNVLKEEKNPVVVLLTNVSTLVDLAIRRATFTVTSEEASLVSKTFDDFKASLASLESGEEATVDIKINTLIDLKILMDTAIKRGKYEPMELVTVGTIYTSFMKLIQQVSEAARAQEDAAKADTPPVPPTTE
tara:strand:+ start:1640 stop:2101 length:462 start_codon:yes stop_codon:yes gene_type:complete